jgi:hypothetical protein
MDQLGMVALGLQTSKESSWSENVQLQYSGYLTGFSIR